MSNPISNNLIIINEFNNNLNLFESYMSSPVLDDSVLVKAGYHLKTALDQLIYSYSIDSFQMMRSLSKRMSNHSLSCYSDSTLLVVANVISSGGSDIILTIPYGLNQIEKGILPSFDEIWFSKVNSNKAIKLFFETYLTSDIFLLKSKDQNNIIESSNSVKTIQGDNEDSLITVKLGKTDLIVNLTAFQKQTLKFVVDTTLSLPENYNTNLPLTIKTNVLIKAGIRKFVLDKSIKFTDHALSILKIFDFIENLSTSSGAVNFTIPNHFYSYKLELISYNSGDTWLISNVLVLDPSSY